MEQMLYKIKLIILVLQKVLKTFVVKVVNNLQTIMTGYYFSLLYPGLEAKIDVLRSVCPEFGESL